MPQILLVEDSATHAAQIRGILQKGGFDVVVAENGREAVRAIQRKRPDLVLTDLQMPEMNGLQLVEAIQRDFATLPIVLITAHGSEEMAVEALKRGAASYVPKHAIQHVIVPTLKDVLELAQLKRDRRRLQQHSRRTAQEFSLDNDPSLIPPLLAQVEEAVSEMWQCDRSGLFRQMAALREAVRNAMYHGNLQVPAEVLKQGEFACRVYAEEKRADPPYSERSVRVTAAVSPSQSVYVVTDDGEGFDVTSLPDPADPTCLEVGERRGLVLIRSFMDEVSYNDRGNEVTITKRRDA